MNRVSPPLHRPARPRSWPATGVPAQAATSRRVLVLLGRFESGRLCRNALLLAAYAAAAAGMVLASSNEVPVWWVWDMKIGTALLVPAGVLLVLTQLAAGRARRDDMQALYDSYPAGAQARMGGHLLGLAGQACLAAAVTVAAVAWLDAHGALGSPRLAVLAGAVLLVATGGAIGVAIGAWRPHPMAGLLAAILLGIVEFSMTYGNGLPHLPQGSTWLFPWRQPDFLGKLPGPVPGAPPAGAHAAELAALIALAVLAAIGRRAHRRRLIAALAAGCLAVAGGSGWLQARPVQVSRLSQLVADTTRPAAVERCTMIARVRYCAYPAYLPETRLWAVPVSGVLARVPGVFGRSLVVRQLNDNFFLDSSLTGLNDPFGQGLTGRARQLAQLYQLLETSAADQGTGPAGPPDSADSPVYVDLSWGQGSGPAASQFDLALLTASAAVGLPTLVQQLPGNNGTMPCLPDGQARQAIAVWLAAASTPAARAHFAAALASPASSPAIPAKGQPASVSYWLTSQDRFDFAQYLSAPDATAVVLAAEMLRRPAGRVAATLAARWSYWRNWRTSAADLATALGIALPAGPSTRDAPPAAASISGQPVCR